MDEWMEGWADKTECSYNRVMHIPACGLQTLSSTLHINGGGGGGPPVGGAPGGFPMEDTDCITPTITIKVRMKTLIICLPV